jgi:hypothetical protein
VEGDDKPGGLSFRALSVAISSYLERNPPASCREIAKDLFVPMTIIPRVLEQIASRFFTASWCPMSYRLSRRRTEWIFVKRCWKFWKSPVHDKRIILFEVMNARCTWIIITADNGQQIAGDISSNLYYNFIEKNHNSGLFHSPRVCFG